MNKATRYLTYIAVLLIVISVSNALIAKVYEGKKVYMDDKIINGMIKDYITIENPNNESSTVKILLTGDLKGTTTLFHANGDFVNDSIEFVMEPGEKTELNFEIEITENKLYNGNLAITMKGHESKIPSGVSTQIQVKSTQISEFNYGLWVGVIIIIILILIGLKKFRKKKSHL
ncbi:hypothetical protein ACFLZX_05660 [Nanoarchaeota archaeon]